jgi:hypothetical protein
MPVPTQIAYAAYNYQLNAGLLKKSFDGLTPEEWLRRPSESSNHLLWIVGHVVWARGALLGFLGSPWSTPWLPLFARGAKLDPSAAYPTPQQAALALEDVSARLTAALEAATEESLSQPSPERIPSADGKIAGLVDFLSFHDSYHVGQAAYLRCWLGHDGVAG